MSEQTATKQADRAQLVERACRYIETCREGGPSLQQLGAFVGLSPGHLQRIFKQVMGASPRQYAEAVRLGRVKRGLQAGSSVTAALYDAGFGSARGLYEQAGARMGMTPAAYRRRGRGLTLSYAISDSPLGRVLLAATPRGICALKLGDADAPLRADLAREYPAAELREDNERLRPWVQALLALMEGRGPAPDLPLDVQATAFQARVWQVLRAIPRGQTRSYGEVAAELGNPGGARAVARACATNPVAVLIPCHRVLGGDGELRGYRWGLARKQALLELESK